MIRRLLPALLVAGLSASVLSPVGAETWERFRGPNGQGEAKGQNIPAQFEKSVLWKKQIPGLGNSSPVIWNDKLFLQTSSADGEKRFLVCLNPKTGDTLWSREFPGKKAHIHKLNSLASATPAVDGESVFIPFWNGEEVVLLAYSFKGDLLWQKDLGKWTSQHGPGGSPFVYQDKVYFVNDMDGKANLYAFNKKSGAIDWEASREAYRACYSVPFVMQTAKGKPELIVTSTTSVRSYNPDDGDVNWNWNWSFQSKMPLRTINCSMRVGDLILACSGDGGGDRHMVALKVEGQGKDTKVSLAWENRKDFPYVPCLLTKDGNLYFVNDKGFAGCVEAKSGKKIWFERQAEASFLASPVMIDGKVFAPSDEGDVFVFEASPEYKLLARNVMGERIRATPAVADGRLFLRGQNHLFCIGAK